MKKNRFGLPFVSGAVASICVLFAIQAAPLSPQQPQPLNCKLLTQLLLAEIGVTPDALAAIDASDIEVTIIVTAARGMCETSGGAFASAQQSIEALRTDIQTLERKVQSGEATEVDLAAFAQARIELNDATATRQGVIEQVRILVDGTLSSTQVSQLANIAAARKVSVPVQYKVVARADSDWVGLRDYLGEKARAARENIAPPPTRQEVNEVEVAADNVSERLMDVRLMWREALTQ